MQSAKRAVFRALAVLGLLMAAGFGVGAYMKHQRLTAKTERPSGPVPVVVTRPVRGTVEHTAVLSGTLLPASDVTVVAKVSGEILEKEFAVGDFVEAGAVLYRLDDSVYRAGRDQAAAGVAQAEAARSRALAAFEQAQKEFERVKNLYREGSATRRALDAAQAAFLQAKAALSQAEAAYKQARAALSAAAVSLEDCTVTAPIAGFVSDDFRMDKGDTAAPGRPLARIVDKRTLKAAAQLPGKFLPLVRQGKTGAHIYVAGHPERIDAVLSTVNPAVDPAGRSASIECEFPNPKDEDGRLLLSPGAFARVEVVLRKETGLTVPASALIRKETASFVTVLEGGELRLRLADVTPAARLFARIETGGRVPEDGPRLFSTGRVALVPLLLGEGESLLLPNSALVKTGQGGRALPALERDEDGEEDGEVVFEPVTAAAFSGFSKTAEKSFGDVPLVEVRPDAPRGTVVLLPEWALLQENGRSEVLVAGEGREPAPVPVPAQWVDSSDPGLGIVISRSPRLCGARFRLRPGGALVAPEESLVKLGGGEMLAVRTASGVELRPARPKALPEKAGRAAFVEGDFSGWKAVSPGVSREETLLLPEEALRTLRGATLAVKVENGFMTVLPVEAGLSTSRKAVVRKGLSPDDVVLASGVLNAYDGAEVRVVEGTGQTAAPAR